MGKNTGSKKKASPWTSFLKGGGVSLAIYLGGVALLAALMTKGTVPETAGFPVVAALCLLAVLCGGVVVTRGAPWGPLPASLLHTAVFALVLIGVGLGFWQTVSWTGHGGILLLCALAGGVLAGLLGGRRRRLRKRR
jgi:phosphate/sulfate permease